VNNEQPRRFAEKVRQHFGGKLEGRRLAVWGLSFKPKTNDMRDAPAIAIVNKVLEEGASVMAYDPAAMEEARRIFAGRIELAANNYACLAGADALLLITEWQIFRNPDFDRMKGLMRHPVIFDGRNIYDPATLRQGGFTYYGIGKS
jgi:UDPglucose 6-dehydrogenase